MVALGIERQIDADQLRQLALHRPGGEHDMGRFERLAPAAFALDLDRAHPLAGIDADDLAAQELRAALARRLQHHGAELLRAEPAGAARMGERDRVGRRDTGSVCRIRLRSVITSAPASAKSKPRSGEGV